MTLKHIKSILTVTPPRDLLNDRAGAMLARVLIYHTEYKKLIRQANMNQWSESSFKALSMSSPPTYFFLSPAFKITTVGVAFNLSVFMDSL